MYISRAISRIGSCMNYIVRRIWQLAGYAVPDLAALHTLADSPKLDSFSRSEFLQKKPSNKSSLRFQKRWITTSFIVSTSAVTLRCWQQMQMLFWTSKPTTNQYLEISADGGCVMLAHENLYKHSNRYNPHGLKQRVRIYVPGQRQLAQEPILLTPIKSGDA